MLFRHNDYAPNRQFVAPALARSELWRTFAGGVLITLASVIFVIALFALLQMHYGTLLALGFGLAMQTAATPGAMTLLLFTFTGTALGVFGVVRWVHGRSAMTLFGPRRAFVHDFTRVFGALLLLQLVLAPLSLTSEGVSRHHGLGEVLPWLPLGIAGILVQSGAEELVFRGYLQQQLAVRFRSPLIWMGVPSALFGLAHFDSANFAAAAPLIVLWAVAFGCLAADLTARTGNLGAAIALHFVNNVFAMAVLSPAGEMDGLALWTVPLDLNNPSHVVQMLAGDVALMIISWLAARVALRL